MGYINLKYKPSKNDLIASFYVEPAKGITVKKAAEHVASESSIGTWTDVATMLPRIRKLGAKVFSIKGNRIKIAYPLELFEPGNMSQILSSIAGNIFGMKSIKNVRLEDISLPYKLVRSFKGPKFGIKGIRKLLWVKKRPLVGTIIKPKLGLSEAEHAKVAYDAWTGGCDIVKDDENLTNMSFNNFKKRVILTIKAANISQRETGEYKVYMPNITAETEEMLRRAEFVKQLGGKYVMVDIITCGWSALQTLRNYNEKLNLVLHAHRAGHAALTRNPKHGISMLVIAKIARLIGVDQLHIGTIIGKMEGTRKEVQSIRDAIKEKLYDIKPVFPVASGGLHPGHVPELIKLFGKDIIIQMGGGIHWNPRGTQYGAMAARQAVDAVMKGISLKEYAKKHEALREALRKWR